MMFKYCLAAFLTVPFIGSAFANSHLEGTWFNSYCSRVDITVSNGVINGVYTSHTGSTGSSQLVGQVDDTAVVAAPKGLPFSLGIQWRLINVDQSKADGSWHWVSTFSGQYHPAQTIMGGHQSPYKIPETLEILNGLLATATLPGLADEVPVLWPQTLNFHRNPPTYCQAAKPASPVAFTPNAQDNVSGTWKKPDGSELTLTATLADGKVSGTYFDAKDQTHYNIVGLFDTIRPPASGYSVAAQGVTLSAKEDVSSNPKLKMLSGGVLYSDSTRMFLWESNLKSTTWIDRFTQEDLDKDTWDKQ